MNPEMKANTYWEKRCRINEIFTDNMFALLYRTLRGYEEIEAQSIQEDYFEAINNLVDEYAKED